MATKSFKDQMTPAMKFISHPAVEQQDGLQLSKEKDSSVPDEYRLNPLYIEKRSRRIQLLVQPSLHAKLKDRAKDSGCSLNEYIHAILEKAVEEGV